MEEKQKEELIQYIEKVSVVVLGLLFIIFPIVFTDITTDVFVLPKQTLLIFVTIILCILFGVKNLLENKVRIRRTPFDLPVSLFIFSVLLSSLFSVAKFDSFQNFVPFLFAGISYFAIVNNSKNEKSLTVLLYCLLAGGVLVSLVSIASFFKIYIFPFDYTKVQTFTTLGTVLDQIIYLLLLLPVGIYFLLPFLTKKDHDLEEVRQKNIVKIAGLGLASLVIFAGLALSIYMSLKLQSPVILPLETGFQTAFAAISQDSGRIIQGLLFGSGVGEYLTVFTRFKQASFNTTPFWNLTFFRSSTFVLELLATTGVAGLLSFFFLCYKILKEKPLFIPLVIVLAVAFVLPFSYYHIALLFFLLGIYASFKGLTNHTRFFDVELQLVALKKGFLSFSPEQGIETPRERENSRILSYSLFGLIAVISFILGFLTTQYLISNIDFQKSVVAASQNNGSLTYQYQTNAINTYKYSDVYQRIFAQTNLSLANTLASSVPQGATPSAQTTQTVYTLVQQAITAARQATVLSPQNTVDWQNLAIIYRGLIGFGQNADSFAILAAQQAVQLDPSNPQEYITLGGIYYQLNQWDKAQTQFQQAISLKPDYANAYYNLGHTLIQTGDLKGALTQFETVKSLVANDPANLNKINGEIQALQVQIGQATAPTQPTVAKEAQITPLTVSTPSGTLPPQNPPVKIPAPQTTVVPSPTSTPKPTPTP